jgi:hypothetical protein
LELGPLILLKADGGGDKCPEDNCRGFVTANCLGDLTGDVNLLDGLLETVLVDDGLLCAGGGDAAGFVSTVCASFELNLIANYFMS